MSHAQESRRSCEELAHVSMTYDFSVYGDAVHEEVAHRANSELCMACKKTCDILLQ